MKEAKPSEGKRVHPLTKIGYFLLTQGNRYANSFILLAGFALADFDLTNLTTNGDMTQRQYEAEGDVTQLVVSDLNADVVITPFPMPPGLTRPCGRELSLYPETTLWQPGSRRGSLCFYACFAWELWCFALWWA